MTLYAFDGTGNAWGGLKSTLVFDVAMSYHHGSGESGDAAPGSRRPVLYLPGVGTTWWIFGLVIGGLTGAGAKRRARQAYQHLCEVYANKGASVEELMIDVVGFSRGGATALHFCNLVRAMGIRDPRPRFRPNTWRPYRIGVGWIWFRDWAQLDQPSTLAERLRGALPEPCPVMVWNRNLVPTIRFVGLWDAVGSFGLPIDARVFDFQNMQFGFNLVLPPNVTRCAHAMALDERRKAFRNLRVTETGRLNSMTYNQARRFRRVSLLAVATLAAGLFLWPLGTLDDQRNRLIWIAVVAVTWGTGVLLGTFNVEADERWRGMQLAVFTSMTVSTYALLYTIIEWIGGRSPHPLPLIISIAFSCLLPAISGIWSRVIGGGSLWINPVDIARRRKSREAGGAALAKFDFLFTVIWATLGIAVAVVMGMIARWLLWLIGGNDRSTVDWWKSRSQTVSELWFRGNHTDIGGGGSPGLVTTSLAWMCAQAKASNPPLLLSDNPPSDLAETVVYPIGKKFDLFPAGVARPILAGDRVHASVDVAAGDGTSERFWDRLKFACTNSPTRPYDPRRLELLAEPSGSDEASHPLAPSA